MANKFYQEPQFKLAVVPVTPLQQNCTLIWNVESKLGAVIDPGGDVDYILEAVAEHNFVVEKIVLTHGHFDHAGGADELREKLGVKIEGPHIDDKFLLDDLVGTAAKFQLEGGRNVTPDRWIEEGETIEFAGLAFDVFHCPGHSPGSLVYVNKEHNFAFVGDVLFRGSIGRTDFPYGDHNALISAIQSKLLPLGDEIAFICGHGPPSTFGEEKAGNPFII
ncbi:MAG: hydroxyacylglutathione hydrolase [Alphaproteobacteria bacterium]|jgi:hydroxyacylglutathione hydrolase